MAESYDPTKLRLGAFDVKWNSNGFGIVDDVDLSDLKLKLKEKKGGSIGDVTLGHWIIGLEGMVSVVAREIDLTFFQRVNPWFSSGDISLVPATWHKDLYDYAQKLVIHPNDLAAATATQDFTLYKTVPVLTYPKRDGENPDAHVVKFQVYPDRSQLATSGSLLLSYGVIGAGV